ncbi:MAG: hypothetical protein Wins2KO_10940 [Winogradskyella sp.]
MKPLKTLVLIIVLSLYGCGNNDDNSNNPLDETNLLDKWEISGEGTDNIMSLEAICCGFIEFLDDNNTYDLSGTYNTYVNTTLTGGGNFTIDLENNVLTYTTENNNTYTREFSVIHNTLEFWYFDNEDRRQWTTYERVLE